MSTTKQITYNTIVQIVGKIISSILGLFAIGILTRHLGTERFGWYVTTISFLQFIGIAVDFGMIPVSAKLLGETDETERPALIANLLGFRIATAGIAFLLAPAIAMLLPYPTPVKIAILLSSLAFFGNAIAQIFTAYFQTTLRMCIYAVSDVVSRLALLVGMMLAAHGDWTFLPVMIVVTLASIIQTVILAVYAARNTAIGIAFNRVLWKKIISTVWPVAISIAFNVIYLRGDALILPLFRPQGEVGLYGAAYRVLDLATQVAMMAIGVTLPILSAHWSRGQWQEFHRHVRQATWLLAVIAIPGTLIAYFFATPLMRLIAGASFAGAGTYLAILSLAIPGIYLGALYGHTALAIGRQKETIWVYLGSALVTLGGYLLFIPRFGAYGAAWMSVGSEVFVGVALFLVVRYYVKKGTDISPSQT